MTSADRAIAFLHINLYIVIRTHTLCSARSDTILFSHAHIYSVDTMENILSHVIALAEKAGRMMADSRPVISTIKGTKENYATEADEKIQQFLENELLALLPGSSFMGEEQHRYSKSNLLWIVDPIDGTVNYARGIPISVVSIALVENGKTVLGIVHNPYMKETFHAEYGEGAFLNDSQIYVSDIDWNRCIVSTAWCAYEKEMAPASFRISERLHSECSDIRRLGTAAYEMCLLAKGSIDVYFEMMLRPWDYAAASLIVTEAGGFCSSLHGDIDLFDECPVLAANTEENLRCLTDVVIREKGDFEPKGTIW